ncbi:MAG TPA: hypothetical protein VFT36_01305, partial [Methylomirabilota bacterium]|nr:hypothetical protein [Methylomirabilota bacterium]
MVGHSHAIGQLILARVSRGTRIAATLALCVLVAATLVPQPAHAQARTVAPQTPMAPAAPAVD